MGAKRPNVLLALAASLLVLVSGTAARPTFPKIIPLPDGFFPEGIAVGHGTEFLVGSLLDGSIFRGDLSTGEGSVLVPGQAGLVAVGLKVNERTNHLFVAGGFGAARVYDAETGALLKSYQLTTATFPATFVNDVIVTREAAYFTDSFRPVLYRLPLGHHGSLPDQSDIDEIPLSGDFVHVAGAFNTNGIVATHHGEWLIIINSALGVLYRVDPDTGDATEIDLDGASLTSGDGLLLDDNDTLYVVRNVLNTIAVVRLDRGFTAGEVVDTITDPAFRVPTTIAEFGHFLYAVNARFNAAPPPFSGAPLPDPPLEYEVVRVSKHER